MSKNRLTLLRAMHKMAESAKPVEEVEDSEVKGFVKRSYALAFGVSVVVLGICRLIQGSITFTSLKLSPNCQHRPK